MSKLQTTETNKQTNKQQEIIERSFTAGGETNRLISKKMKQSYKKNPLGDADADEYPGYARFVEEATLGYSAMQV